jgi:hypothetical protein
VDDITNFTCDFVLMNTALVKNKFLTRIFCVHIMTVWSDEYQKKKFQKGDSPMVFSTFWPKST